MPTPQPHQTSMLTRVAEAIGKLNQNHEVVPCQKQPEVWDDDASPVAKDGCASCPVLHVCRPYALSGAVTHGIVAGISMPEMMERKRLARRRAHLAQAVAA